MKVRYKKNKKEVKVNGIVKLKEISLASLASGGGDIRPLSPGGCTKVMNKFVQVNATICKWVVSKTNYLII